jgi:sugar lactone lactonase YvrE
VDTDGHVYVSDTGNKRIAIFDENGEFLQEFGGAGLGEGQLDEPVGLALDENGNLYVADTWNQRVQVFEEDGNGIASVYKREWEIDGWYGQSLDNKPYLTVAEDLVFISDPEASRILAFSTEGEFLYYWGTFGAGENQFSLATGLAADNEGGLWVSDTKNNRLMYFLPPEE